MYGEMSQKLQSVLFDYRNNGKKIATNWTPIDPTVANLDRDWTFAFVVGEQLFVDKVFGILQLCNPNMLRPIDMLLGTIRMYGFYATYCDLVNDTRTLITVKSIPHICDAFYIETRNVLCREYKECLKLVKLLTKSPEKELNMNFDFAAQS